MPKFKPTNQAQGHFLPVFFPKQLQQGTFEFAVNYLVDHELDLFCIEQRYNNDETGAPAYDPCILLKVILLAYSRGITSSRDIAKCCEENVVFMALSSYSRPITQQFQISFPLWIKRSSRCFERFLLFVIRWVS